MTPIRMRDLVPHRRFALAAAIVAAESFFLIAVHRFKEGGSVGRTPSQGICEFLGGEDQVCVAIPGVLTIALMVSLAPLAWLLVARRGELLQIASIVERSQRPALFLVVHFVGFAGLSAPWLIDGAYVQASAAPHFRWLWAFSVLLAAGGFTLWLTEPKKLAAVVAPLGFLIIVAPLVLIFVTTQIQSYIWFQEWVRVLTFKSVEFLFILLGKGIHYYSVDDSILGIGSFKVEILNACSGLSGILLVTLVMLLYVIGSRKSLRLDRALLIFPAAIFASWALNIIRISVLLLIGEYISPDLAVSAFHSYAGWVIFTLLSAAILVVVESSRWFHKGSRSDVNVRPSFFDDQVSAEILPFVALLVSGLVVSSIYQNTDSGYFIIFIVSLVCTVLFSPIYRRIPFSSDKLTSMLGGLFVAAVWLFLNNHGGSLPLNEILVDAAPMTVMLWCTVRVLGTTLLVPVIEEMFFRSYLLSRLDFGNRYGKFIALALSSIAFAVLHGDFVAALIAGLVFGALVLRNGKVGDAILAHVIANGVIAIWALSFDDWSVI